MNYKAIVLATIIGLTSPVMIDLARSNQAIAQTFNYPEGTFADRDWTVSLSFANNAYVYYGENNHNGSNLVLSGAVTSGNHERQVYIWNNDNTRYRVTWRPSDHDYIRIEVISPNNRLILNRLLTRIHNH